LHAELRVTETCIGLQQSGVAHSSAGRHDREKAVDDGIDLPRHLELAEMPRSDARAAGICPRRHTSLGCEALNGSDLSERCFNVGRGLGCVMPGFDVLCCLSVSWISIRSAKRWASSGENAS